MDRRTFIKQGGILTLAPVLGTAEERETGTLQEPGRAIPVIADVDVLVAGAGPAGIAAALAAARKGARVALLEVHGCLGGIWTAGALSWILDHNNKGGIMAEILDELSQRGARTISENGKPSNAYDLEEMKLLLEELCVNAGVHIHLFTRVVSAIKNEQNQLTHVITESKSGREAMRARRFVDTTGDGDLAARAGCGFDLGHPETGAMQPFSLMALVMGVQAKDIYPFYRNPNDNGMTSKQKLKAEMERGGVSPSYAQPTLFRIRDDLFALMANHEYGVSAIDARDVTAATLRARREVHRLVQALRSLRGPWQDLQIVATGEQIGTREGRRIHGVYQVTGEDLREGRRHEDSVCHVRFGIDVHATHPDKTKGIESKPFSSKPYDIPLRALIAKDVDGLMMAGRCISGDFIAHSSYRVTGNAVALGEAAGKTAALAALHHRRVQDIQISEL